MEFLSSLLCQATRLAAEAHDGAGSSSFPSGFFVLQWVGNA